MPGFRPASITVHPDLEAKFAGFEEAARHGRKPEAAVWKALQTAIARIRKDAQWGEVIPTSQIPAYFTRHYQAANLYCIDLAGFRRALYTIDQRDVLLLEIVDHRQYDRWFPNRGK